MIAIVPARGGSKGLPGKNIKELNGKPLIAYTIEAALQSQYISDVIVSTDDRAIYDIAISCGAKETFLRPRNLSEDSSLAIDNYIYTVARLEREFGYNVDSFVVLQPTSPLRSSLDIDGSIELFKARNADSVVSYCEESHPITWHKYLSEDNRFENIFDDIALRNRQDSRPSFFPNGAVYVFARDLIERREYYSNNSYAYIMPASRSVDIDTLDDFNYARFLLERI